MILSFYTIIHIFSFFFFNDTATTEIYTLSLHDALPIFEIFLKERTKIDFLEGIFLFFCRGDRVFFTGRCGGDRSEEHTSELQSQSNLVCRLLLEKKKIFLILSYGTEYIAL